MGVIVEYTFVFSQTDSGGTRVDLQAVVQAVNPLGWLMAPLVLAAIKKSDGDLLARLKRMIEQFEGSPTRG
jgi:hypothetical protein